MKEIMHKICTQNGCKILKFSLCTCVMKIHFETLFTTVISDTPSIPKYNNIYANYDHWISKLCINFIKLHQ